ncbi:MAG: L,D-transpeptidase family protein [Verrucomicrobiales bacterium]|jgi:hypothetical protein
MKRNVLLALCVAFAPWLLVSCGTTGEPIDQPIDQPIPYLAGIGPAVGVQRPLSPMEEGAYWDGDGVQGSPKIVIDLSDQKAYFYKSDSLVGVTPISSGDSTHKTPTGNFKVTEKDIDHRSSRYGDYVDEYGNVVKKDVDNQKDKRPPGSEYLGADMGYFLRFNRAIGMHRGFLPGYPASHGCVRQPEHMAQKYFENAEIGTPVNVVPYERGDVE